jgi:hypothetical protein
VVEAGLLDPRAVESRIGPADAGRG